MVQPFSKETAPGYLRENFGPQDRLAVITRHHGTGSTTQRLATAEKIAAPDFQAWLRYQNASRREIYVSMNALHPTARGRTKDDVAIVRHIYLDFDHEGTAAVQKLMARTDLPQPNYLINSSPDKWQVIWKVEGFGKEQAEDLQRGLVIETGADPAAVDCARVMRLPGFNNHKYAQPHYVSVESLSKEVSHPQQFSKFLVEEHNKRTRSATPARSSGRVNAGGLSQSERDWAYAKRVLMRGDPEEIVIAAIAAYRRFDKHDPQSYAERTVRKAAEALWVNSRHSDRSQPDR